MMPVTEPCTKYNCQNLFGVLQQLIGDIFFISGNKHFQIQASMYAQLNNGFES